MGDIHDAAARGDIEEARKLIQNGIDINRHGDNQYRHKTPLKCAIENGHTDIVELLLNHGANINQALSNRWDWSSLLKNDNTELIDLLLRRGAPVNFKSLDSTNWQDYKDTALLHLDFTRSNIRLLVEMLLAAGADVRVTFGNIGEWTGSLSVLDYALSPSVCALLYAAGAPYGCTSGYPRKDAQDVPQSILDDFWEPMLPLKGLCRRRIRRHLLSPDGGNHNNLIIAVPRLPLPRQLKQFLLFEEECTYTL